LGSTTVYGLTSQPSDYQIFKKDSLRYVWHNPKDNSEGEICKFKGTNSGTEYRNPFADISDKRSLIFYT
jgi:hypothetical protein